MGSVFTWESIDKNAPKVPGALKRRLEEIDKIDVLPAEEGTVAATKRARQAGYVQAVKTLGKYSRQALRPLTQEEPVIYGEADQAAVSGEDLTSPVIPRNDLDIRLSHLLETVSGTKEGSKKGLDMAGTEELNARQKASLTREAKGILFREYQRNKRLKKIKSKAFRKHKRADLEKARARTLERLEEEDPEAAAKLREEYQAKRAELRMQKAHRARRRWAQMAARFGGKQAAQAIQTQFQNEREKKDLLNRLAGKSNMENSESESDDEEASTTDEEIEGLSKEEKLSRLLDKTAGELADAIEGDTSLIPKGIRSMKFMQRGEERRKAELAKEAEIFLQLLEEGFSEMEAKQVAKERAKDDFVKGANDLPDVEQRSFELARKKREALDRQKGIEKSQAASSDKPQQDIVNILSSGLETEENKVEDALVPQRPKKVAFADEKSVTKSALQSAVLAADPAANLTLKAPPTSERSKCNPSHIDAVPIEVQLGEPLSESNEELVNMAFALTDTNLEEFHAQQEKEALREVTTNESNSKELAGWGSWTGEGIRNTRQGSSKIAKQEPPVLKKSKAIYNLDAEKVDSLYKASKVPSEFNNREQHNALMSQPIGQEWLPEGTYRKLIEPRVKVRVGTVVAAMKYKGPKHMRKGL